MRKLNIFLATIITLYSFSISSLAEDRSQFSSELNNLSEKSTSSDSAVIDCPNVKTAQAMQNAANIAKENSIKKVNHDYSNIPGAGTLMSCLDKYSDLSLNWSNGNFDIDKFINSLMNKLASIVCNKVDSAWNAQINDLKNQTAFTMKLPGVGTVPVRGLTGSNTNLVGGPSIGNVNAQNNNGGISQALSGAASNSANNAYTPPSNAATSQGKESGLTDKLKKLFK